MAILVYGLGRSGMGVLAYLSQHNISADYFDQKLSEMDKALADQMGFVQVSAPLEKTYTQVIAAPGVPIDHPDLKALEGKGAEIIGEAELVYRNSKTSIIAITGTAGKTSTTMFTAHFLRAMGFDALEGGNIDPPLTQIADECEVAVTEMSSFQLERIKHFRPRVAVLLNLGVDHIDRHGTLEAYHDAKLNLIANLGKDDCLVFNSADQKIVKSVQNSPARLIPFIPDANPRETNRRAALAAATAYSEISGAVIESEILDRAWKSAPRPAHRFETIARIGDLIFIDDSIATRFDAVKTALEAAPTPIAWILGGEDKGAPSSELLAVAKGRVKIIFAIGRDGSAMADPFRADIEVIDIKTQDGFQTLLEAVQIAQQRMKSGSVLLAPLATSFDQFKDYKARSSAFRDAVLQIGGEPWIQS